MLHRLCRHSVSARSRRQVRQYERLDHPVPERQRQERPCQDRLRPVPRRQELPRQVPLPRVVTVNLAEPSTVSVLRYRLRVCRETLEAAKFSIDPEDERLLPRG